MKRRCLVHALSFVALLGVAHTARAEPQNPQVRSNGAHSTAIGVVNGNVIVRGPSNAEIAGLVSRLNALKAKNAISEKELQSLIDTLNASILPMLSGVKGDTEEIKEQVRALNERLGLATNYPDTARDVLRPFMKPAFDLSNQSYPVSKFLDAAGDAEYKLVFAVTGNCLLYIDPPQQHMNFAFSYGVLTDHGTTIFKSMMGIQPKYPPIQVSSGTYQFFIQARRNAGTVATTISARCN